MPKKSIFIVEDEIITARSIAKNIQKIGHKLAGIATSGSQAIQEILVAKPDLVLMDIFLDKNDRQDGISAAAEITSQLNIPIVYLTAHSDQETLERAKTTTPFGYILKPYSKKNLQITIEFALHKHEQEIQLIQKEKLLSTILNATRDGIMATNQTNKVIYMNPAAEELTGWKSIEAQNHSTADIIQVVDQQTTQPINPIETVLEQGEVLYLDETAILIQKSGQHIPISDSISPILDQSDRISGAVLIFTPRSNSWLASQKHHPLNSNNLMPVAANQKLNKFGTYLIELLLHELRTPLTVILSTAESLQTYRRKWTVQKQDQGLKRIQQAIGQITRLLNDLTIWDELGKRQLTLQQDWLDVVSFSKEILADLELINEKNQKLVISSQLTTQFVYIDQDLLRYVLTNLLLNGMKYSAENSTIRLKIALESQCLIFKVENQGIGIPQAEQERIFEPFFRASNASKIKGNGLGLAIVQEYVNLCGGTITLENNLPAKTIFKVTIPLKMARTKHNCSNSGD